MHSLIVKRLYCHGCHATKGVFNIKGKTVQPDRANQGQEVYLVPEVAQKLQISERSAYDFCKTTKEFKVFRCGRSIRIQKESFDRWFYG